MHTRLVGPGALRYLSKINYSQSKQLLAHVLSVSYSFILSQRLIHHLLKSAGISCAIRLGWVECNPIALPGVYTLAFSPDRQPPLAVFQNSVRHPDHMRWAELMSIQCIRSDTSRYPRMDTTSRVPVRYLLVGLVFNSCCTIADRGPCSSNIVRFFQTLDT